MKKIKDSNKKVSKFVKIFDYKMFFYDFVKWFFGWPLIFVFWPKRIYYKTKRKGLFKGEYIISANHISYTDIFKIGVAFWFRRISYVATEHLYEDKVRGWLMTKSRVISINKDNPSLKTFKEIQDRINRGHLVAIFPEGEIKRHDKNGSDYKSGVILMSLFANAPILPMYYKKKKKWYHRQKAVFGPKFYVKDHIKNEFPTIDEINNCVNKLKEIELELAEYYDKN